MDSTLLYSRLSALILFPLDGGCRREMGLWRRSACRELVYWLVISPSADVSCSAHMQQLLLINRWVLAKLLCEGRSFFFFSQQGGGSNLYHPPARPVSGPAHWVSSHHRLICVTSARCTTLRPCGSLKKNDVWGFREVIFLIVVFAEAREAGKSLRYWRGLVCLTANSLLRSHFHTLSCFFFLCFFDDIVSLPIPETHSDGHDTLQSCHNVLFIVV